MTGEASKACAAGHQNPGYARSCYTCGTPLQPVGPQQAPAFAPPPAPTPSPALPPVSKSSKYTRVECLGLLLLAGACTAVGALNNGGADPDNDRYSARAGCQEFVERRLKAPSSADFSDWSEAGGAGRWTVTGTVDSENSFGAKLPRRSCARCTLTVTSGSSTA
jgi:hypothetical protein